jgi:SOS-response transcriptional repressor LexA
MDTPDLPTIRRARLAELIRDSYAGSQAKFIAKTGENQSEVSGLLSGKKSFGEKKARKIEREAELMPGWLDVGPGQPGPTNVTPGPDLRGDVPVVSWVTAGHWFDVSDPYEPGIAADWRPCPKSHSPRTFALRVRGVSMENPGGKFSYSDGDIIFVDPERHYENGSRVIVRLEMDKEATFKQLVIEGEHMYLKALNPSWPEKIIEINGNATICGVVIGKWTDE